MSAKSSSGEERLVELMVRYQQGDASAFDEVHEQLRSPVRGYLISLAFSASRVDDLVQETFLQLHRSRHTYRPPKPVKPWVFGVARHVFLMDRRAARRHARLDAVVDDPSLQPMRALGVADLHALMSTLVGLPAKLREPVLLHHVWGFDFKEIGGILGIRPGTARVRCFRGLERLRRELGVTDREE